MAIKLEDISNFLQLTDTIATAGQPTEKQLSLIKDAGYKIVINLATSASPNALSNEKKLVESLGMKYINIPIDFNNPTSEDLINFCQVLEHNNHQPLLIHCAANKRVSAFMYIYRLRRGNFAPEQAKIDLAKIWTPNKTWQKFIDDQLAM